MADSIFYTHGASRSQIYEEITPQIRGIIEAETDMTANLANVAAILKEAFDFFWVGFYRRVGEGLVLGPFQGPLACTRIALDKGVCGAAASQKKTIIVPDVDQFPGHIACSSASKSEIVVPLVIQDRTELILDVDSDELDDFSEVDQKGLEAIMRLIGAHHFQTA